MTRIPSGLSYSIGDKSAGSLTKLVSKLSTEDEKKNLRWYLQESTGAAILSTMLADALFVGLGFYVLSANTPPENKTVNSLCSGVLFAGAFCYSARVLGDCLLASYSLKKKGR
jgi:hypothetical protein